MPIIKPGKIGAPKKRKTENSEVSSSNVRVAWDDYARDVKKTTKKQEYQRGAGNRMIKKPNERPARADEFELNEREGLGPKSREDFEILEQRLGYTFKDKDRLERALTHRSAVGLRERADYERLEFLGDAVLDLAVAHLLSDIHPEAREGELSKMRAALVNTQALASIATEFGISSFIRLGRGEYSSGGAERPSILADVMEALIGAMYRDSSFDESFEIIKRIFGEQVSLVNLYDPKTELQEVLHLAGSEPPEYLLELVEGPEHSPTFVSIVRVDGEVGGRGKGNTKKQSQQNAAAEALNRMIPSVEPLSLNNDEPYFINSLLLPEVANEVEAKTINVKAA